MIFGLINAAFVTAAVAVAVAVVGLVNVRAVATVFDG
jgi:hypothetical protein